MRSIDEIKASDRVYQFKAEDAPWLKGSYSCIYTFKDRRQSCTLIITPREVDRRGGAAYEHASISILGRGNPMPTWEQMCEIKDLVWQDEEECYQVFPKKSQYVHEYGGLDNVMHIWRDIGRERGE